MITKDQIGKVSETIVAMYASLEGHEMLPETRAAIEEVKNKCMALIMLLAMSANENEDMKKALSVISDQYVDLYTRLYPQPEETNEEEVSQQQDEGNEESDVLREALKAVSDNKEVRDGNEEDPQQDQR